MLRVSHASAGQNEKFTTGSALESIVVNGEPHEEGEENEEKDFA